MAHNKWVLKHLYMPTTINSFHYVFYIPLVPQKCVFLAVQFFFFDSPTYYINCCLTYKYLADKQPDIKPHVMQIDCKINTPLRERKQTYCVKTPRRFKHTGLVHTLLETPQQHLSLRHHTPQGCMTAGILQLAPSLLQLSSWFHSIGLL